MEFGILGPLEVRDGERVLPLGGAKQRTVLALLLLQGGETVSSDRLIDGLWGERPPATAAAALQVYVSRLRKVLPAATLVTAGRGYRLVVADEQVDAHRFEQLLEDGKAVHAQGDPDRGAQLLADGLALWRGPALADFAYDVFAQGEIGRLEELRVVALEERAEADLARGRHAELVGELEAMIAAHPLRERPRGQLMRALYRSGRQAEALEAYQRARRTLVEELGIEPSPALRDLQRAILAQDSVLGAEPAPTVGPGASERSDATALPPEPRARKVVTVLFADVGTASALSQQLDPERLERVMSRFFDVVADVMARHGGTVDKFTDDAVMAVFGAPAVHEDDAVRALRAALDLREALAALNPELGRDHGIRLAMRTGVNTGEVLTGDATHGRLVTGDAVVVATLLESAAPVGEILVGERTASAARGAFEFSDVLRVQAEGRAQSVAARGLVRALSWDRPRGLPGRRKVFVGRRSELDLLAIVHERMVRTEEPHLVAILGEPGLGKSSLVAALKERIGAGTSWHVGRCLAYGEAVTYRPLAEILRSRLGLDEGESAEMTLAALGVRPILGLTLGIAPAADLHPQEARRQLQDAWIDVLGELAAEGPAVVVIEDLHWAQEPLLELLGRASGVSGPLLLVLTGRPEFVERWPERTAGAVNASQLRLEPLSREEGSTMLAELHGLLPDRLRDLVLDRAGGNPFFVEEVLAALDESGVLDDAGATVPALALPDSVQGVIAARIDQLPIVDKHALQAASVVGSSFWEGAVRELLDGATFDPALLEQRGFVRRRRESSLGGERELVFKHALTREVAYGSLPLARRAQLHAAIAAWLERTAACAGDHASLLAHHYSHAADRAVADLAWPGDAGRAAELRARAVGWLRQAAGDAVARYEVDSATSLLEEALVLTDDDRTRTDLLLAIARACRLRYDTDAFRAALERALSLDPPAAVSAEILSQLAHAGSAPELWRTPPGRAAVEAWAARSLALAEPRSRAAALALMARARTSPGSGRASADAAVDVAERIGDPALIASAFLVQAEEATARGALEEAREWTERALAATSDPFERDGLLLGAVFAFARLGRIPAARACAAEHDAITAHISPHQEVHAIAARLVVETTAASWGAARALAGRAEAAAVANRDTPCQFNWRSLLMAALAHGQLGEQREARRLQQRALSVVEVGGPASREPALIRLELLRGDLDAVERLLAEDPGAGKYDVDYRAARLDALAALGDAERVEREAAAVIDIGGYAAPFGLRALGVVRGERDLLDQAAAAFDALGLDARADETRSGRGGD